MNKFFAILILLTSFHGTAATFKDFNGLRSVHREATAFEARVQSIQTYGYGAASAQGICMNLSRDRMQIAQALAGLRAKSYILERYAGDLSQTLGYFTSLLDYMVNTCSQRPSATRDQYILQTVPRLSVQATQVTRIVESAILNL